jgi:DNA polymerase III subunit epsilon
MNQLSFIDVETTGLHPFTHEIVEVAIINESNGSAGPLEVWSSKVAPSRLDQANPIAMKINGFNAEEWRDAPSIQEVGLKIKASLCGKTAVGHNVGFDLDFLSALCVEAGVSSPGSWEDVLGITGSIDTSSMVREHLFPTGLKSASLDATRTWMGWSLEGNHRALKDAQDCRKLYHKLKRSSVLERTWWAILGRKRTKPEVSK